jgi:hypothetical protein
MTAIYEGTEIDNARHALERVGNVVIEKVPDVIEATKAGLRSVAEHGEALAAVLPANEDLGHYAKAGMRRVQDAADHLDIDLPGPFQKSARSSRWRRGLTFLALGIFAGLVLNRVLRDRHQGSASEANELLSQKDPGMVDPYHTSVEEAGDERSVFHDRSDCPAGSRIKPENRVAGTAGRSKCKDCQNIAA